MDTWYKVTQATWSMPRSNRLLFDAGYSRLAYIPGIGNKPPDTALNLIPVTEQANIYGIVANWTYRGIYTYSDPFASTDNWRAWASYVTGANSVKLGYQGGYYLSDTRTLGNDTLRNYRFNNQIPNRVTFRIAPWETGQSHDDALDPCAGPMDEGPAHAGGRAALRPGVELVPGGAQRRALTDDLQLAADHLRSNGRRHRVSRPDTPHERGL